MKFLILSILVAFAITSCSTVRIVNGHTYKTTNNVEKGDSKRHVSSGESQKSKQKQYTLASSKDNPKQVDLESSVSSSLDNRYSTPPLFEEDKTFTKNQTNKNSDDETLDLLNFQSSTPKNSETLLFKADEEPTNKSLDEDTRVLDLISILSFSFSLLGVLSIVLSIVNLNSGLSFPVLLFLGCAFFITAFILGLIAFQRKKRDRTKYKGVVFAILGFIGGVAGTILFLLVIIALLTMLI